MVLGYPNKKSLYHENPYARQLFMTIFEFIGRFYFQNDVLKLQIVFSELGIREFLLRTNLEVTRLTSLTSHTWLGLNPQIGRPLSRIVGATGLLIKTD
jgi:hypothetical protein